MTCALGIDFGTTKNAVIFYDGERPENSIALSASHYAGFTDGTARQDFLKSAACVRDLIMQLPEEKRNRISAIGLTGQMHSVVLWNNDTCSPVTTWQDKTASATGKLELYRAKSGCHLCDGFGAVTLAMMAEENQLSGWTACGTPADRFAALLCGKNDCAMDPTFAASWGIFDLQNGTWNRNAAGQLGIPFELLPRIVPSGSCIGRTKGFVGLPDDIPVMAAFGDNQASIYGTSCDLQEELFMTLGTGAQLSYLLRDDEELPSGVEARPFLNGSILAVHAPLCGGRAWAWLAKSVNQMLSALGLTEIPEKELMDRLDQMALNGNSNGLTVQPHFLGERSDPTLRGTISGIDLENFTLPALATALGNGIIHTLAAGIPEECRKRRKTIVGSGNGLRLCQSLRSAAEQILQLPVVFREVKEEAATGAAKLALKMNL